MIIRNKKKNPMKLDIFKLSLCGLGLFSVTSCVDLDQDPDERVTITNLTQVKQLLTTAYNSANYGWICEISSDNVIDLNAPFKATQSNGKEVDARFNMTAYDQGDDEAFRFEPVKSNIGNDSPYDIWEGAYHAIAVANHAIANLDKLKAADSLAAVKSGQPYTMSKEMEGCYAEARLSRAYNHFVLVNIFSQPYKNDETSSKDEGVPYVTAPEDKVKVHYDRGTVTEDYRKIEADLLYGLAHVYDANYTKPKWHWTQQAANAFAARFYLYKKDYDKVIKYADAVLGAGTGSVKSLLIDRSSFDNCTSSKDYANVWQSPDANNNILLVATYSRQWRRSLGYRYACAGKAIRDVFYHLGPNWLYYAMPCASASGETFWDGNSDHGFCSSRIAETFQYSDKVSGIGYAHIIRREFTCTELLLERAEAYLLKNDIANGLADLIAYEGSRQSFSASTLAKYQQGGALTELTKEKILSWYKDYSHSNTYDANYWAATQQMGINIPADVLPYWNCLNDMRRYETAWTGLRFFDLKRWGLPITHVYDADAKTITLKYGDPRLAIEVPQAAIAAGLTPSRPVVSGQADKETSLFTGGFFTKENAK